MTSIIDIKLLVEQANELAPFPASTVRLAQLVVSPECNLSDVVEVVLYDQALTLKLMRVANSAANAGSVRVINVLEAITRLGISQLMALAVAAGVRPHFQKKIPSYRLDEGALWRHSVAAAVATEIAGAYCTVTPPPESFTSALLHDVGKLVMGRFLDPDALSYIALAKEVDHLTQMEAETQVLTVHHGELGGLIAQHWKLPPRVATGIIYHHNPEQGNDVVCDFTYLANEVAKRIEAGLDGREFEFAIPPDVAERVGATPRQFEKLCASATAHFSEVSQRYDV